VPVWCWCGVVPVWCWCVCGVAGGGGGGLGPGGLWGCGFGHAILWAYGLQPLKGEAEAEAEGKKGEDLTILGA
jgi:hypothetical protein